MTNQPNLGTSRTPQMTSISPPFATFQWSLAPCSACALSQRQLLWGTQPAGVRYIQLSHESIYAYMTWFSHQEPYMYIMCKYIYTKTIWIYIYIKTHWLLLALETCIWSNPHTNFAVVLSPCPVFLQRLQQGNFQPLASFTSGTPIVLCLLVYTHLPRRFRFCQAPEAHSQRISAQNLGTQARMGML